MTTQTPDAFPAADDDFSLDKPYVPQAIHYEEADTLEFVWRDVPTVARPVQDGLDALLDMDTREPIGWRIYDWSLIGLAADNSQPTAAPRWHPVSGPVPADGYILVWPTEFGVPEVWAATAYHEAKQRKPGPGWAPLVENVARITHWAHLPTPFPPAHPSHQAASAPKEARDAQG